MCVGSRDGHLVGNSCERIGHRAWDVASRARNKRRRRSGAAQKLRDQLALAEDVQTIRAHRPGGTELLLHAERRLLEQRVMRILVINDDSHAACRGPLKGFASVGLPGANVVLGMPKKQVLRLGGAGLPGKVQEEPPNSLMVSARLQSEIPESNPAENWKERRRPLHRCSR